MGYTIRGKDGTKYECVQASGRFVGLLRIAPPLDKHLWLKFVRDKLCSIEPS